MSRRRVYRDETIAVMQRFFQAIDFLISAEQLRGIQTFCNTYEIDKRHFYHQKNDLNKGFFEIYWIIPLIKDFNVSEKWLLLGTGRMFVAKSNSKSEPKDEK